MKRNTQDLEEIVHLTLEHYNQHAAEFWQGTRDHDVSQNIAALLQCIRNEPPFKILDFGCGPGRDLKTFAELGHIAIGLEGAVHLAIMARAHSGCEVWQQDFLKLHLPDNHFDGVFAKAALFHVPSRELPRVLLELKASLKPGGVLFSSNPRGHNEEGWSQGRSDAFFKMSAVGSLSVSPRGRTDNAFSRRAGHTSVSALDVRTGRLQWGTAVHWREHHKIEYKLEASLRQVRPRRLGGCHLPAGRLPPH